MQRKRLIVIYNMLTFPITFKTFESQQTHSIAAHILKTE